VGRKGERNGARQPAARHRVNGIKPPSILGETGKKGMGMKKRIREDQGTLFCQDKKVSTDAPPLSRTLCWEGQKGKGRQRRRTTSMRWKEQQAASGHREDCWEHLPHFKGALSPGQRGGGPKARKRFTAKKDKGNEKPLF